jgi:hypothetical protein
MKSPSFFEGVVVALTAGVFGSVFYTVLPGIFGPEWTMRALFGGLGLGYVLYLLHCSRERTGRIVVIALWSCVAGAGWFLLTDPLAYLLMHLGLIWLVRTLYHQPGPLAAVLDLALNLVGTAGGLWAFIHTGSVFMGIWTFFLAQACFVAIPALGNRGPHDDTPADPQSDRFQLAYRNAETALRRLSADQ